MSDTETVADLAADRQTWSAGRRAGTGRIVHLDSDCYRLSEARHIGARPASQEHPETVVCSACAGQEFDGADEQDWSAYRAAREAGADD